MIEAAVAHLQTRIALPLAPPADWRREATLTCRCERCAALARFLDDPVEPRWTYRAVQADRGHVETTILNSRPDVATQTLRKGSPHSLICTKTNASHDRRAAQRLEDLKHLAALTTT
jgi:hypothetical protein